MAAVGIRLPLGRSDAFERLKRLEAAEEANECPMAVEQRNGLVMISGATPGAVTLTERCHRRCRSQAERMERLTRSLSGIIDQESYGKRIALRSDEEPICSLLMAQQLGLL